MEETHKMGHKPAVHSLLARQLADDDAVRAGLSTGVDTPGDGELVEVLGALGAESRGEVHGRVVVPVAVGVSVCAC